MMSLTPLILASDNPGKLRELTQFFRQISSQWDLNPKPAGLKLEETGTTFEANAQQKARSVALTTQSWAIADDSGLAVEALGGAPGVYSARYADSDAARIQRVLTELGDQSNRQAKFCCVIALCNPQGKTVALSTGICNGEILTEPRGSGGFGYDPIFYIPSLGLTFAELSTEQKQQISHRGQALQNLRDQLIDLGDRLHKPTTELKP